MSLKAELNRLRRELATLPADGTDGRPAWGDVFDGEPDSIAHHLERCRVIALDSHTGRLWREEHLRLGLPPPTDVPDDVCEQLILMGGQPTPEPNHQPEE